MMKVGLFLENGQYFLGTPASTVKEHHERHRLSSIESGWNIKDSVAFGGYAKLVSAGGQRQLIGRRVGAKEKPPGKFEIKQHMLLYLLHASG
jgi:hypothetical protein